MLGQIPIDTAAGNLESGRESTTSPGIDVPFLGRLQLPRTRQEREGARSRTPVVIREGNGDTQERLRFVATRIAARLNQAAKKFE